MLLVYQVGKPDLIVKIVDDIGIDAVESSLMQVFIGDVIENIIVTVKMLYQQLQQPLHGAIEGWHRGHIVGQNFAQLRMSQ